MALFKAARRWLVSDVKAGSDSRSSATAENQRLREDLALAYRAMAHFNLQEHILNHLSVRAPARNGKGEVMLVIAFGMHWSQVTASSLLGVDLETGEVVEGKREEIPSGKHFHLVLHRLKGSDGIRCIMHTHQPYVTALACCHGRLKNVHQTNMLFHNKIAYDDTYGGRVNNEEEGKRIAECIGDKKIVIMGNHGVTAIGKRICDVFDQLYSLERACMYQIMAMSTGMELVEAPDHIAEAVAKEADDEAGLAEHKSHFEALRCIIARMEPDYKS